MHRTTVGLLAAIPLLLSWGAAAPAQGQAVMTAEPVVTQGLGSPLFAAAPEGDDRLFVLERDGRIRLVKGGIPLPIPFLDITAQVGTDREGGLLGLAFAPNYHRSGFFYVYYTDLAGDSVVSRFRASAADPDRVLPGETVILTVDQPAGNHNGGTIAFGPDGFLYLGLGDGGGSNDPQERAQDPSTLLGKMLRLDVGPTFAPDSLAVAGEAYRVPADNPFVGDAGVRDEIWALGLRNPYRFSFDRATGHLWIADVGQDKFEEVNVESPGSPGGRNYGWDVMEGTSCNATDPAPSPPCNDPGLTLPLFQYGHMNGNCSITGGFVHRGPISALSGLYFYGDFCSGRIWTLDPATLTVRNRSNELGAAGSSPFTLVGFGEDGEGNLLVVHQSGEVYRIRAAVPACADGMDNDGDGAADHPADPGCRDADADDEAPACDDGIDNDGDGDVDGDDSYCQGAAWLDSESPRCGLGGELALLLSALALRRFSGTGRSRSSG